MIGAIQAPRATLVQRVIPAQGGTPARGATLMQGGTPARGVTLTQGATLMQGAVPACAILGAGGELVEGRPQARRPGRCAWERR